jgi:hypothetical protein
MHADAKLDPAILWQADVTLNHAVLNLDRAVYSVDDTAELDERAVSCALDDPATVRVDRGIYQISP